jgi:hypothetical protein
MRSTTALLACLITPALTAARAAGPELPVREVTVFKDGHALVLRQGSVATNARGDVELFELPAPVLGAFWPYSAEDGATLRAVTAGATTIDGERPVRGLWELLEQNLGATVAFRDTSNERIEGVVESLIPEGSAGPGPMVAVRIRDTLRLTPVGQMRDLTFLTGDIDRTATENTTCNTLTIDLDWGADDASPASEAEVGLMYLQRGLRWIPGYRITIDGNGAARVELQATLVNELIDLDDVTMNLVIGAPSFAFAGTPDPIGLQEQIAQLGRHFDPRAQTGQAMGQALMTQARFGERREYQAEAGAPPSPEVIGSGRTEDLFVFTLTGVSLKQGERMVIPVAQYDATYEDVFRLDLPLAPPPFAWQHFNTQQQREAARLMHRPRARHIIRLTNGDQYPITTAPALVMAGGRGEAARVLAQGLIPYTPARATADLAINEAFDIEFEQSEREVERRMNDTIFNGSHFHYARLAASMTLTNHRDTPVRMEVTRYVLGTLDEVPETMEATSVSVFTDDAFAAPEDGAWWTWYHWPWWWMRMNGAQKLAWHTTLAPGATETVEWTWHYWWQ